MCVFVWVWVCNVVCMCLYECEYVKFYVYMFVFVWVWACKNIIYSAFRKYSSPFTFSHFVMLQLCAKIISIQFSSSIYTQYPIMTKQKQDFRYFSIWIRWVWIFSDCTVYCVSVCVCLFKYVYSVCDQLSDIFCSIFKTSLEKVLK